MTLARRSVAILGAIAVLIVCAAPASARSADRLVIAEVRMAPQAAATRDSRVGMSPPPCQDRAFNTLGGKQKTTYKWSFRQTSTPSGLGRSAVAAVLNKAFNNVTGENNDCGRADTVSATSHYLGTTSLSPNCSNRDGHNVIGFAKLDPGTLAVTCYWINGGKIVEADMQITTRESWALSLATCHGNMPMLEATITHEAGHVFGLDHVGENRHGRLTMSPYIDGPCENNESTLGLGDMLGLESLY